MLCIQPGVLTLPQAWMLRKSMQGKTDPTKGGRHNLSTAIVD